MQDGLWRRQAFRYSAPFQETRRWTWSRGIWDWSPRWTGMRCMPESAGLHKPYSECLDIDRMVQIAQDVSHLPDMARPAYEKPKTRIGVALDTSFNFYYRDNLEALRRCGATLEFFSPVTDAGPPDCDGLYIGGGFPEVLGDRLAGNRPMQEGIRHMGRGRPSNLCRVRGADVSYKTDHVRRQKTQDGWHI